MMRAADMNIGGPTTKELTKAFWFGPLGLSGRYALRQMCPICGSTVTDDIRMGKDGLPSHPAEDIGAMGEHWKVWHRPGKPGIGR